MKNIIAMVLVVIGFVVGCGDAGSTTVIIQNSGSGGNVGSNNSSDNSNVGGNTITLDTMIITSSGGDSFETGGTSNNSSVGSGGTNNSNSGSVGYGGSSSCTPRTCNEAAYTMAKASNAKDGLGNLVNWDYMSITACGEVSDGCGNILNCVTPSCTSCGTVNNSNSMYPTVAIAGVCASTMCYNYAEYNSALCVGDLVGKELWFCNAGDAVGPRTKSGCVSIANPDKNDTKTVFCCTN